jgi:hypothetical protein
MYSIEADGGVKPEGSTDRIDQGHEVLVRIPHLETQSDATFGVAGGLCAS